MNTNTLRPEYAEIAEVHLLALDAGHFDHIPDAIRILELVKRCQQQAASAHQAILAKLEAAEKLRDEVRAYRKQLRAENVVDNLSGAYCAGCRLCGLNHCGDPINCGGLNQMREPTREEWLTALKFLAAFDKEPAMIEGEQC